MAPVFQSSRSPCWKALSGRISDMEIIRHLRRAQFFECYATPHRACIIISRIAETSAVRMELLFWHGLLPKQAIRSFLNGIALCDRQKRRSEARRVGKEWVGECRSRW